MGAKTDKGTVLRYTNLVCIELVAHTEIKEFGVWFSLWLTDFLKHSNVEFISFYALLITSSITFLYLILFVTSCLYP